MADPGPDDLYESWYQNKLWQLLPAVYRVQDATASGVPGPLQELLNRIGAQTATLRRSIDRLGEESVDRDLRRLGDPLYRRSPRDQAGVVPGCAGAAAGCRLRSWALM